MSEPNGVMMQYFHWYVPSDGSLWNELAANAKDLAKVGITSVWLPPSYKGTAGGFDVGYGVYDIFDLGEFDQKGSVRTKYGTKEEYLNVIKTAQSAGIQVYADVVFNHKLGADEAEEVEATPFDPDNRNAPIGEYQKIKAWTQFTFPGRGDKYSSMKWHWWHFDAIDYNAYNEGENAIYLLKGKEFDRGVDLEKGNFDYLMGCDLDMSNPEVTGELKYWAEWYLDITGVDGFRFDAVKHVSAEFFQEWIEHARNYAKRDLFAVGEYWSYEIDALHSFVEMTDGKVTLFDVPLHNNFQAASKSGNDYDMRQIFDNTLVQQQPTLAVTLVDNHDSQPLQSLESVVEAWFKPLAYALILLRREGYPCIFYADYYGAHYKDSGNDGEEYEIWLDSHRESIDKFLFVRQTYAYGDQYDYFDHANTIGWTRLGDEEHVGGMAVVLSNGVWATIEDIETDEWDRTINVNLRGTFLAAKYAVPYLKKQGGAIIITSSINGTRSFRKVGATPYACTKAAQVTMAKMLALELAPSHIRVNVICPGGILTGINNSTTKRHLDWIPGLADFIKDRIPLTGNIAGTSEEVAQLVSFLASDASRFLTGTEVWIDGGGSLV